MTAGKSGHPDELVSAAVSGDLTAAERARLEAHLASCPRCQEALAAQTEARRLLSLAARPEAPANLGARIQTAVASGSGGGPRLRRVGAAVATVAAAIVLFAVFRQTVELPGASQEPSASAGPSGSAQPSNQPSPNPTEPAIEAFLAPGDIGYLLVGGGGLADYTLTFVNARTGDQLPLDAPSGEVLTTALSPDGGWLAYASALGESGMNEIRVASLTTGDSYHLGCTAPRPYADRLAWSPDSWLLGYTLVAGGAGGAPEGCAILEPGNPGASDAWLFGTGDGISHGLTTSGEAYAASFEPGIGVEGQSSLAISHLAEQPWSDRWDLNGLATGTAVARVDGLFMPLLGPPYPLALFYRPVLAATGADNGWDLQGGGIPLIGSGTWVGDTLPFSGVPTIDPGTAGSSLTPWQVAWSADGDTYIVWAPNWSTVFIGHASQVGAEHAQEFGIPLENGAWIVGAALSPDGTAGTVTMGWPRAGIGGPPHSVLFFLDLTTGTVTAGSTGGEGPGWFSPVVYGTETRPVH